MTMTRRDFENLAKDLRWAQVHIWNDPDVSAQELLNTIIDSVIGTCKAGSNGRFDSDRFRAAVNRSS